MPGITSRGLTITDYLSTAGLAAETRDVAFIGNRAYMSSAAWLFSVDITDPTNLVLLRALSNADATGYAIAPLGSNHVVVAEFGPDALSIHDVTDIVPFVSDTFTGTTGTLLTAHTPEVGGTISKPSWATADLLLTDANRVRSNDTANFSTEDGGAYYAATPPSADYDVSADVVKRGGGGNASILLHARADSTAASMDCYRVDIGASGSVTLYKTTSAAPLTSLGSATITLTADVPVRILFECRNAAKKVYADGVLLINSPDNATTRVGKAGLQSRNINSNTVGLHADNFQAIDRGPTATVAVLPSPTSGTYQDSLDGPNDVVMYLDRYAIVASSSNKLTVVDCQTRSAPSIIAALTMPANSGPTQIAIVGNTAWVGGNGSAKKLSAVDLTTPSAPTLIGSGTDTAEPEYVTVEGNYAYTATSGPANRIAVWDISTPSSPTVIATLTDSRFDRILGVVVDRGLLLVGSQSDVGIFCTADVRNPAVPVFGRQITQPTAGGPADPGSAELYHSFAIASRNGYAWLAVAGAGGLTTVDLKLRAPYPPLTVARNR